MCHLPSNGQVLHAQGPQWTQAEGIRSNVSIYFSIESFITISGYVYEACHR